MSKSFTLKYDPWQVGTSPEPFECYEFRGSGSGKAVTFGPLELTSHTPVKKTAYLPEVISLLQNPMVDTHTEQEGSLD